LSTAASSSPHTVALLHLHLFMTCARERRHQQDSAASWSHTACEANHQIRRHLSNAAVAMRLRQQRKGMLPQAKVSSGGPSHQHATSPSLGHGLKGATDLRCGRHVLAPAPGRAKLAAGDQEAVLQCQSIGPLC
jgi:hypothetical protein